MSDKDRIRHSFQEYATALRTGDAKACGRFYAQDAEYMACGMAPVHGRASIVALHEEIFRAGYKLESMQTEEIRLSRELAYVRQTLVSSEGTSHAMLVLRREASGNWLVHAEAEMMA